MFSCLPLLAALVVFFKLFLVGLMLIPLVQGIRKFVMSAAQKPQIVFVLGAPGSGKGTICKNIVEVIFGLFSAFAS